MNRVSQSAGVDWKLFFRQMWLGYTVCLLGLTASLVQREWEGVLGAVIIALVVTPIAISRHLKKRHSASTKRTDIHHA